MKRHKISEYNINNALKEIDEVDYIKTLNKLSEKVWDSTKGHKIVTRKKKFISALKYRGWENNLIYEKLNEILN